MPLRQTLLAVLTAAALTLPAPPAVAGTDWIKFAYVKAAQTFQPPCGQPHLEFVTELPALHHAADANPGTCTIRLLRAERSPAVWCEILLHEFGHLTGLEHTDDRRDIMFPYSSDGQACPFVYQRLACRKRAGVRRCWPRWVKGRPPITFEVVAQ